MFVTIINEKYNAVNIIGIHVMCTARVVYSTVGQGNAWFVYQVSMVAQHGAQGTRNMRD